MFYSFSISALFYKKKQPLFATFSLILFLTVNSNNYLMWLYHEAITFSNNKSEDI